MVVRLVTGGQYIELRRPSCTFTMSFTSELNRDQDRFQVESRIGSSSQADTIRNENRLRGEGFPNLQKKNLEGGLKRFREAYLTRISGEFSSGSLKSKSLGNAVQLPGIGDRRRRIKTNQVKCHEFPAAEERHFSYGSTKEAFNFSGSILENGGSETGSESWTSGNGSTSPRRKIRVPTPISRTGSCMSIQKPSFDAQNISPRPPVTPRGFTGKKRVTFVRKSQVTHDNVNRSSSDSTGLTDEVELMISPNNSALKKSRNFKTTLQNIHGRCKKEEHDEHVNNLIGKPNNLRSKNTTPESASTSQRRKSTGDPVNDRDDESPRRTAVPSRRLSMPSDLQKAKRQSPGIDVINVREYSRAFIQHLLVRRETRSSAKLAGDEQRQKKCLSWLKSLEQSR